MKASSNQQFGAFVLLAIVTGALGLSLTLWNTFQLQQLVRKPAPSLVQLDDGRAIRVRARPSYEREEELIRRFVGEAMGMLFTWRSFIPAAAPEQPPTADPGVILSNRSRLPTSVYQAGFCLAEQLRAEVLRQLATLSAQTLKGRRSQVVFTPRYIGQPRPVRERPYTWTLNVVGSQVVYGPERLEGTAIPFNKQVVVRAVDPPPVVDPALPLSPLEAAVLRMRNSGLEIVAMRSLTDEDLP